MRFLVQNKMDSVPVLLLLAILGTLLIGSVSGSCMCGDPDLCQPVVSNVKPKREIFMFTTAGTTKKQYSLFDWSKITTLALTKYTDDDLICYGHSKGTKVVLMVSFPGASLFSKSEREGWVALVNRTVYEHHMDGAHLDFEDFIELDGITKRKGLYDLFSLLSRTLKTNNPDMQVTIDFDADPLTPHHVYGYAALMKIADFAFLRTYDQRRWIAPPTPCRAWAMDANNVTILGLKNFQFLGIPLNKLIPGFAWYGFDYKCENLTEEDVCFMALYEKRCTVVKAKNHKYEDILEKLVPISARGPRRDPVSGAPYLNYKDPETGDWRQVWYNDPVSLRPRYALAEEYGLRGVGAWVLPDLDYTDTPEGRAIRQSMFDALPDWK